MQILLCAATSFEIQPTIEFIKHQGLKNVDVLITGVGLTAATYKITKTANQKRPDFILQAGVAGSLDLNLALAKVILVKDEVIGDSGVMEGQSFHSLFDLNLAERNIHPWKNSRLSNSNRTLLDFNLPIVNGITVNEISTNPERIRYYKENLNAQIETLEGAALHFAGLMEDIPFLQVRSISNFIGERNKSKWQLTEAIVNLNAELQKIILKLVNE
jgi:futalosine hydrolase